MCPSKFMKPNPADKNLESAEKPYQNPYYSQPNYNQYVINNQQFNQYMNYPMYYPQPPMKVTIFLLKLL